jgi:hypothetical protein
MKDLEAVEPEDRLVDLLKELKERRKDLMT